MDHIPATPIFRRYTVTKAFGSDLFDAAATTDSADIFTVPAGAILIAAFFNLDVAFVAGSMTDLDITVGDAGDPDGLLAVSMNLTSGTPGARYEGKGAYFPDAGTLHHAAATTYKAYATANGANLSTLSAGQVTFTFITMEW